MKFLAWVCRPPWFGVRLHPPDLQGVAKSSRNNEGFSKTKFCSQSGSVRLRPLSATAKWAKTRHKRISLYCKPIQESRSHEVRRRIESDDPVSYTHLTLPTNREVSISVADVS